MSRFGPGRTAVAAAVVLAAAAPVRGQGSARPTGRVSVHVTTARRVFDDGARTHDAELATAVTLESAPGDRSAPEFGVDLRHTAFTASGRADRLSVYNAFAGVRIGTDVQVRVRGGHLWLPDLGSTGALAGGLIEIGQGASQPTRFRVGAFSGLEPELYDTGYAPHVRKFGGYAAFERGYRQRHVIGYTLIRQGSLTERSVVTTTNFLPVGEKLFAYQAAEFDVTGAASGAGRSGLSYFLANVRVSPSSRVDLNGSYNRGRSLDARRLTEDVINGRPLTPEAVDGLRYESAGGRVTVEVVPRVRIYAGYSRDRTNREDAATGRTTFGGHAGNVFGTGFDISGSDSRVHRPGGAYHSRYVSVGRAVGRSLYLSADYSTSLSLIRFLRSDGLLIETRPSSRRYSGTGSAVLTRHISLLFSADYSVDDTLRDFRFLSGLSYRIR
jgi:hypothetical protein